jgi:hypothetical protein
MIGADESQNEAYEINLWQEVLDHGKRTNQTN